MPLRSASVNAAAQTQQLLDSLWTRNLPTVQQRLALLDSVAQPGVLTPSLRTDAVATAHKLAGSLGMFGYTEATHIARRLELALESPTTPDPATLSTLAVQLRKSLNL